MNTKGIVLEKCMFAGLPLICACFAWSFNISCRRESDRSQTSAPGGTQDQPINDVMVFPAELYVDDLTVNEFVERAMGVCASGDYEKFRLVWSAKDDPLPREEYEQGWQAVQKIEVRALERVILAGRSDGEATGDNNAYVFFAEVSLDPNHRAAKHEPHREVVMLLIQEQGEWRLAHAPKGLREWVKERVRSREGAAALPVNPPGPDTGR